MAEREKESKHERFVRIAEARTNKMIDLIRLLGNCSSKTNYEYSEEEIRRIFSTIEKELRNARSKFSFDESDRKFSLR